MPSFLILRILKRKYIALTDNVMRQDIRKACLSLICLIVRSDSLAPEACFSVVLPSNAYDTFVSLAAERHLYVRRCTSVFTKPGIPAKRVLVELGHGIVRAELHDLYIEVAPRIHSDEYVALTKRISI